MANVMLVTSSTTDTTVTRTKAAIETGGHVVTAVSTAGGSGGLDTAWSSGSYDAIAWMRENPGTTPSISLNWVRDKWAAGVPLLIGVEVNHDTHSAAEFLGLLANSKLESPTDTASATCSNIASHAVTAGFTAGANVTVLAGGNWSRRDLGTPYGTRLGSIAGVSPGAYFTAVDSGDPINAAAAAAPGSTAPARAVFCGWMYASSTDYSADGKTLLVQSVNWLADTAVDVSLAAATPGLTSVISIDTASPASLAADLPGLTSAITLDAALPPEVALAGSLPALSSALAVEVASPVTLAGQLPGLTSAITLDVEVIAQVTLAGSLPMLAGLFGLGKPPETDTSNRVGGRERGGFGVATWEPPVEAPPVTVAPAYARDVLMVPTAAPTVVAGRPTITTAKVEKVRHRDRVLVGGKDITFFRGAQTPTPSFRLVEPLSYGAGTLTVPQVSPAFEQLGVGALKWVRKGAQVVVQRVNAAGVVVAKDYHGFVDEIQVQGNTLVLMLAGRVSGRLAMQNRQPPLVREAADAGLWVAIALRKHAAVPVRPVFGPQTGISLVSRGGGSMLDYTHELLAMSTTRGGDQWTVSERADGAWTMHLKDRTTVDATVYFDDARVVADLHSSLAEEPNRVFASGVAEDGRRIKNAKFPGLRQGPPARYPFANEATTFGVGTTEADTDYPGMLLLTAYKSRLHTMGYLPQSIGSTYTQDWAEAVEQLQADAGLPETGVTDLATWRAAWDLSATGYSLRFTRIEPMAQHPAVKPWNLSGSGAIIGRNSSHKPHVVPVDVNIDVGVGFSRKQIQGAARRVIRESQTTPNWIGTVKFSGAGGGTMALVAGEHTVGTPVAEADLMPARALRPGMNVWAPLFDGGTLFHVSGVSVSEGGDEVEVMLDTRARDTMAAWEVVARNRESRSNLARAWLNSNRRGRMPEDFVEWDEVAGEIEEGVAVQQGKWTVFPVVAGQAGTVAKLRTFLAENYRYALAVFARKVTGPAMDARFPQPLSMPDDGQWDRVSTRQWLDDHGFLYQAGTGDQPCGYFPGRQNGDDGEPTGDPLTGRWEDDAGFGYYTQGAPVLYVAVWVFEGDSTVRSGRIMWNQLEGGVG